MSNVSMIDGHIDENNLNAIIDKQAQNTSNKLVFLEIIADYHPRGLYYEIKYFDREDGRIHIGYSSYSLAIISEFLREYFMIGESEVQHNV